LASRSLRGWIHLLGATALAAYVSMIPLSYVQTPTLWSAEEHPRARAFFESLAQSWSITPPMGFSGGNVMVIATYFPLLALTGAVTLLALLLLMRHRGRSDPALPGILFGWALAFGAACLPAFPVFTQDFWLSQAWGRMIAAGVNPYYTAFTPAALDGLPLDHFPMAMSYGPLWGLLSAGIVAATGGSLLAAAILFKLVLAAAWVGTLVLVERMMRARTVPDRCLAIVVLGWTPLSATQSLAEGHNDIMMAWLITLWLYLLLRGRKWTPPFALMASVLCKFTTAPLFLVDAAFLLRRTGGPLAPAVARYALRLVLPAVLALAVLLVFYRSLHFFDGINLIRAWEFLQPADAVEAVEDFIGIPLLPLTVAVIAFFPAVALYWLVATVRSFSTERLLRANLAVMAAALFSAVPHLWSWYLIWVLAPAALVPTWWLSRFVVGTAIMSPFTVACWWIDSLKSFQEPAALAVYVGALLWMGVTRPPSTAAAPGADAASMPPAAAGAPACGAER
jgi:alpha-1,6-mannosyltransferase